MNTLCRLGHVASSRQLAAHGVGRRRMRAALADGTVARLRRGIYGCAHLDAATMHAAAVGGAVTCVSALAAAGVWSGPWQGGTPPQLHVQVPPTASERTGDPQVRVHWDAPRFGMRSPWWVSPRQALWQAMHCLDEENAIAAMESAAHEGFLTFEQVQQLGRLAPRRLQDGIRRLIPNSGSGNETIARLRLLRVGYRVQAQSAVPGMGHEDLVVEDCVGLEVDSRTWHGSEDSYVLDRDRDLHVAGLGRVVIRLRPSYITDTWPHTLSVIDRTVADALRERRRRSGRPLAE
ncbi:hypothetical protein [Parafrigoribacterium mesophilum]|uniref:hypothetical protein n=1 Tax=Parafrigoribacterium mesophilum TaxID=433646 RepID=UPI0031FD9213